MTTQNILAIILGTSAVTVLALLLIAVFVINHILAAIQQEVKAKTAMVVSEVTRHFAMAGASAHDSIKASVAELEAKISTAIAQRLQSASSTMAMGIADTVATQVGRAIPSPEALRQIIGAEVDRALRDYASRPRA